jgi:hypothetical protein
MRCSRCKELHDVNLPVPGGAFVCVKCETPEEKAKITTLAERFNHAAERNHRLLQA